MPDKKTPTEILMENAQKASEQGGLNANPSDISNTSIPSYWVKDFDKYGLVVTSDIRSEAQAKQMILQKQKEQREQIQKEVLTVGTEILGVLLMILLAFLALKNRNK